MIKPEDEELHLVGGEKHWQESWYFNWADPRHDVLGLTRIGFRFNEQQMDGLVLTIRKGRPEFVYPAVNLKHRGSWADQSARGGLRTKGLVYRMEEPLKKWRLTLEGKDSMELEWTSFTPAFDYRDAGRALPPDVAGHHLEQAGRVEGWTRFKGDTLEIRGTGERDKSWGVRNWAVVKGWNWISAQFGEELTFNVWEGFFGDKRGTNGFVFRNGENYPVTDVTIRFEWGLTPRVPVRAVLDIADASGKKLKVTATSLGNCPLVKRGLWLEEIFCRFDAEDAAGQKTGIGIIEHAWHAGTLGTVKRAPLLAQAARDLLLRQ